MGFLDNLKSFGGAKPAAQPQPAAVDQNLPNSNMRFQKQEVSPNSNIGPDGNPIQNPDPDPNTPNPQNTNTNKKEDDPFAKFSKIWDNPKDPEKAPSFTLDPKQLDTIVAAQDFTKGVPAEVLAKAQTGDSAALVEMIRITSQNAYRTAMEHNSKLTEGFVTARESHNAKGLGSEVKKELTNAGFSSIAGSKNPVVKQQLRQTAESLQRTHPDASPEEIVQMTIEYYQQLSEAITGDKKEVKEQNQTATDWDKWFSS